MGVFETVFGRGETERIVQAQEFPETEAARKELEVISRKPLPAIPLRGIAELPEMGPERVQARELATGLAAPTERPDFFSLPDIRGIIQEATERGNRLANRLGRTLQLVGGAASTAGRGMLGRAATEVSKSIAASLAPFAEAQRGRAFADVQRRQALIPTLETLGLTEEERIRTTEQARLDALFQQQYGISLQELTQRVPQLQFLAQLRPDVAKITEPGRPGIVAQAGALAPLVNPVSAAISAIFKG